MRSIGADHQKLTTTESNHQSWSSRNYTKSCPRTQHQPFYCHLAFEANWKGENTQWGGCLMSWLKIKKNVTLKCHLLLLYATTNYFLIGLWCEMKSGLYNNRWWPVQQLDQEAAPKHFPKPNLHQKTGSWPLFGGLLLVWSTTTFWFLEKPLHLRTMLSKSMRCPENCNVYSQRCSTEWAQFSMTTHNRMLRNQCFKSWTNWAMKFCLICHIHLTSRQLMPLLQASQQLWGKGKHFHNQQKAENAFQEFVKSWGLDFYATGINKLISHWQKCVDSNGSYSD